MVRIVGVDLAPNKSVEVALTYIFGIGPSLSKEILVKTGIDAFRKVKDLSDVVVVAIRDALKDYLVDGDLKK